MEKYLEYFNEIACIPHGSGNTKMISDYLVRFARVRNLEYRQDEFNNVIIIKEAKEGYEDKDAVILQGHIDMVAVKDSDCSIDMSCDGLDLFTEGDLLGARGTSLGGDDGIAVAYMLAILDGNYNHPRLECIFTTDEETGMDGAKGIDITNLRATRMINIDNEVEGELIVGCAGGVRFKSEMKINKILASGTVFSASVTGLKGGHSGVEIDKNRGNAIKILADELLKLANAYGIKLIEINGGTKDNVIPSSCEARFMLTDAFDNSLTINRILALNGSDYYFGTEDDIDMAIFNISKEDSMDMITLDENATKQFLSYISEFPNGVQAMSEVIDNLVETSLNMGIILSDSESIIVDSLIRSSVKRSKDNLVYELCKLAGKYGASYEMFGDYPGWEVRTTSNLRELMAEVYESKYLCKPNIVAIHAGLECGLFLEKRPELDVVSFGPDIKDIHSTKERLSLSSAERMFDYLTEVLSKM
ncbi:MAG: beta-Ala-His dipeptidase [Lachnospiraceae bacterium]|nr:beta-Ala-His dipeptidase [Lachnospiraceae bacterium]